VGWFGGAGFLGCGVMAGSFVRSSWFYPRKHGFDHESDSLAQSLHPDLAFWLFGSFLSGTIPLVTGLVHGPLASAPTPSQV